MGRLVQRLSMFAALAALPVVASAQESGNGFLFGAPTGSFTIRGGWALARAKSDLFSFTTQYLTLNRSDFSSPDLEADFSVRLNPKTEIVLSSGLSGMDRESEFRNFVDNDTNPINQATSFRRVPVTLSVKRYLTAPGRSIGRFAWIPNRFATYVGAGVGGMYYKFRQAGDFVDFKTSNVFSSIYESDGWTHTEHLLAGFDYSLGPRFALNTEARYQFASAKLSNDFAGFQRLDLSGLSTTFGLAIRY
jgi:outer membrane protein W